MRELVTVTEYMVQALVDHPEKVEVLGADVNGCLVISVRVGPGDIGKVIGRQGRTARSLRTILGAAGMTSGVRCSLNIEGYGAVEGRL